MRVNVSTALSHCHLWHWTAVFRLLHLCLLPLAWSIMSLGQGLFLIALSV